MKTRPRFQCAPRLEKPALRRELEIRVAAPPAAPEAPSHSLALVFIPLAVMLVGLGGLIAFGDSTNRFLRSTMPVWIVFMSGPPLVSLYRHQALKRDHRRKLLDRERSYLRLLQERQQELESALQEQRRTLEAALPHPLEVWSHATRRPERLWERAPGDDDFLLLRAGVGPQPAWVRVELPAAPFGCAGDSLWERAQSVKAVYERLVDGPIGVRLQEASLVGIVGPRSDVLDIVRSWILQIAGHHAPDEVKIVAVFRAEDSNEWNWTRWLPHIQEGGRRLLAADRAGLHRLLDHCSDLLRRRQASAAPGVSVQAQAVPPFYVVFLDAHDLALEESRIADLMRDGPAHGWLFVTTADRLSQLPRSCKAILQVQGPAGNCTYPQTPQANHHFILDRVPRADAEHAARLLAPLDLVRPKDTEGLPNEMALLDALGASAAEDLDLPARWAESHPDQSLAVPVGIEAGNRVCQLDLHESAHGPHGLVAGTTGSGKSELLKSLVASLAVHFSPQAFQIAFVDYKGGEMAKAFEELPHQVGLLTDLEPGLVRRALVALDYEIKRRERLLQDAVCAGSPRGMPHLLVLVDEFAELRQEHPELIQQLIRIARVGRSLGIHLILATQRPAGVIDEQIWANSRFRVCLRVERPADSREVLRNDSAVDLRRPGRAILQVGNDEIFKTFQSAWAGAPYGRGPTGEAIVERVELDGRRVPFSAGAGSRPAAEPTGTQLGAIVRRISDAARRLGLPRPEPIWLPPLPKRLVLGDLMAASGASDGQAWRSEFGPIEAIVGLADDVRNRTQLPLRLPFPSAGHAAIFGMPGAGKTALLQTIVTSLCRRHPPDEVLFYVLDFGARRFAVFRSSPHVADVVFDGESERLHRLFGFLAREVERRKALLGRTGASSPAAYRKQTGEPLPSIVVVVDGYGSLLRADPEIEGRLIPLLQAGPSLGLHFALAANAPNEIRMAVMSHISWVAALRLADPYGFAVLFGPMRDAQPPSMPGQGLVKADGLVEFQTALAAPGETEEERQENLAALFASMDRSWEGARPQPIPALPETVSLAELLDEVSNAGRLAVPLGVRVDDLGPFEIDLRAGPHFLFAGPPGSGKSSALQALLIGFAARCTPEALRLFLVDFSGEALALFRTLPHVQPRGSFVETGDALGDLVADLGAEIQGRKKRLARPGTTGTDLDTESLADGPVLVMIIDDLEPLSRLVSSAVRDHLIRLAHEGRRVGFHLIAACQTAALRGAQSAWVRPLREMQTGMLLGTTLYDDLGLFNVRVPAQEAGRVLPPGVGFWVLRNQWQRVKLAHPYADRSLQRWLGVLSGAAPAASGPAGDDGRA